MPSTNLTELNALQDYTRVHGPRILRQTLMKKNPQNGLTVINFKDEFTHHTSSSTEMLQSYQVGRHPKGKLGLKPRLQKHAQLKGDIELEPRKHSGESYLARFAMPGSNPYDMPLYMEWVLSNIMAQVVEDMEKHIIWTGVNQGVITGYPNASQDSCDGFLKIIQDDIVSGKLLPIFTGVITAANALSKAEAFLDAIMDDGRFEGVPMDLHLSPTVLRWIRYDYRATYGANTHALPFGHFKLESHPNVTLRPQSGMHKSRKFICTIEENMHVGADGGEDGFTITRQHHDRTLAVMIDTKASVQYSLAEELFVNEQL